MGIATVYLLAEPYKMRRYYQLIISIHQLRERTGQFCIDPDICIRHLERINIIFGICTVNSYIGIIFSCFGIILFYCYRFYQQTLIIRVHREFHCLTGLAGFGWRIRIMKLDIPKFTLLHRCNMFSDNRYKFSGNSHILARHGKFHRINSKRMYIHLICT